MPFNSLWTDENISKLEKIDNSLIIDSSIKDDFITDEKSASFYSLKSGLSENTDYVIVPEEAYSLLLNRYGSKQDLLRTAIMSSENCYKVEIYLKRLKIGYIDKEKLVIKAHNSSRKKKISQILSLVMKNLQLNQISSNFEKFQI